MSDVKRLYKSTTDKKVSGVCGGIAEYANVDSTVIRVTWIFMTLITGVFPGLVAYIAFALILPTKDEEKK